MGSQRRKTADLRCEDMESIELQVTEERDIQIDGLSSQDQAASSHSDDNLFDIRNFRDYSERKKVHRAILDYLRDHYKSIIIILFGVILILVALLSLSIYFNIHFISNFEKRYKNESSVSDTYEKDQHVQEEFSKAVEHQAVLETSSVLVTYNPTSSSELTYRLTLTGGATFEKVFSTSFGRLTTVITPVLTVEKTSSEDDAELRDTGDAKTNRSLAENQLTGRIFCQRVRKRCAELCTPKDKTFLSIRSYTCCCLPNRYVYIRYEKLLRSETSALILRDITLDPANLSPYDIEELPQLNHLPGSWQVIAESDSVYLMKYTLY